MDSTLNIPIKFNIGIYNIRNTTDRYEERKDNLKETISSLDCDILGLQEVSFTLKDQTKFLNKDEAFEVINSPLQLPGNPCTFPQLPNCFSIDGNAIFIKKTFLNNYVEAYESKLFHITPFRNAQAVKFKLKNSQEFIYVNSHLHHIIEDPDIRKEQINWIFKWLDLTYKGNVDLIIFSGDLNMHLNESQNYKLFTDLGYYSAYKKLNGNEPEKTFPTGIKCDTMDTDPPGTTDYLFILDKKDRVKMESVSLHGDKCINNDKTLYPSDHYAIVIKGFEF